jgi:hypothetical protein
MEVFYLEEVYSLTVLKRVGARDAQSERGT